MNPEIEQPGFDQADVAKLLPEITNAVAIAILCGPAKTASSDRLVFLEKLLGQNETTGLTGPALLRDISTHFLQPFATKSRESSAVLKGAG